MEHLQRNPHGYTPVIFLHLDWSKNVFVERFGCVVVDHLLVHWNGYPTLPSHMLVQVTSAEVF